MLSAYGLLSWQNVLADIYKSTDASGHVTYSNAPSKGAVKLDLGLAAPSSDSQDRPSRSSRTKVEAPENFPKVDRKTQNDRDDKRKQILQSELEAEKKALKESKKNYAQDMANAEMFRANNLLEPGKIVQFDEDLNQQKSNIDSHENNIQLLQKELDTLK